MPHTAEHTIRTRSGQLKTVRISRSQAIKTFCDECLGWETHPHDCTAVHCALWPFRGRTWLSWRDEEPSS